MGKYDAAQLLDEALLQHNPHYQNLEPLKKCVCGGQPHIDVSMSLIHCPQCGLCFEYRYNKGVIPYFTWQLIHKKEG